MWFRIARLVGRPALHAWRNARLARLGKALRWRRVVGDLAMWLDPSDFMDRQYYLGKYEPQLVRFISAHVKPGDVCIDVTLVQNRFCNLK